MTPALPCAVRGCDKPKRPEGALCSMHAKRKQRLGKATGARTLRCQHDGGHDWKQHAGKMGQPVRFCPAHRPARSIEWTLATRRYADGQTVTQIAVALGTLPAVIYDGLLARGIKMRAGRPPVGAGTTAAAVFRGKPGAAEKRARCRELYETGLSIQQVADELGVSAGTAYWHLNKSGVVMRPVGRHHRSPAVQA